MRASLVEHPAAAAAFGQFAADLERLVAHPHPRAAVIEVNEHLAPAFAAFVPANAYPPTAHRPLGLMEVMPETIEETPKGAKWGPKLQMS